MSRPTANIVLLIALTPAPAMAYLDPGTGSFILQMLIAGALGAMLYIRLAWDRTRSFFTRLFRPRSRMEVSSGNPTADNGDNVVDQTPDDGLQTR